jgi:hypothetical protein
MNGRVTWLLIAALFLVGCPEEGEDPVDTGIEIQPPDTLDFGTLYECDDATNQILIINHGPDIETVSIDVDSIIDKGYAVTGFMPEVTLEPGDDHSIPIKVAPGPGGAGTRAGYVFIDTNSRAIQILVTVEVVAGDLC